jgi:hypothetical protein
MALRTFDAAAFNAIAKHPTVLPWLGFPQDVLVPDLRAVIEDARNFAFLTSDQCGGYFLVARGMGLYEAHSLALPQARGKAMLNLMRGGFRFMFCETDALEIVTRIPEPNKAADSWAKISGFSPLLTQKAAFPLMGERVDVELRTLHYADWVVRDRHNAALGELFHAKLSQAGAHADHADDPIHDAWVGATLSGAIAGNLRKAVELYNRYSGLMGYAPVQVVSVNPPLLNVGTALVQLSEGALDVVKVFASINKQTQGSSCRPAQV